MKIQTDAVKRETSLFSLFSVYLLMGWVGFFNFSESAYANSLISSYEHVLIDSRHHNAGFGDVGSGYNLLGDFNRQSRGPYFTLLIDQKFQGIIEQISGRSFEDGVLRMEGSKNRIMTVQKWETLSRKTADLVIVPNHADQDPMNRNHAKSVLGELGLRSNVAVLMVTTLHSERNFSLFVKGDKEVRLPRAGFHSSDLGTYYDQTADRLIKMNPTEVDALIERFVELNLVDREAGESLHNLFRRVGEWSFAYRIYRINRKKEINPKILNQAAEYLRASLTEPNTPRVIVTPAEFNKEVFSSYDFYDRLVQVDSWPKEIRPGHLYIFRIPPVPQTAFNLLMYHSAAPPYIEGDSAISSAIQMRKPFMLLQSSWNHPAMQALHSMIEKVPNLVEI